MKLICKENSERFALSVGKIYARISGFTDIDGDEYVSVKNDLNYTVTVKADRFTVFGKKN